jgi:ABC-type uncharacterized transport system substrate-binding protein
MISILKKTFQLILIFSIFSLPLYSHPHLFVTSLIEFNTENKSIKSAKMSWEWDEAWSSEIINECDLDFDNKFDKKENSLVFKDFFSNTKSEDYFLQIFINGKSITINPVSSFSARITDSGTVIFDFILPINTVISSPAKMQINIVDKTGYIAFEEESFILKNPKYEYKNLTVKSTNFSGVTLLFDLYLK